MQITLTDSDLSIIYRAAGPLGDDRDAFIHMVVVELSRLGDLGPGLVFRVAPPIADGLGNKFGRGKYK
jgi:hypothetical protein